MLDIFDEKTSPKRRKKKEREGARATQREGGREGGSECVRGCVSRLRGGEAVANRAAKREFNVCHFDVEKENVVGRTQLAREERVSEKDAATRSRVSARSCVYPSVRLHGQEDRAKHRRGSGERGVHGDQSQPELVLARCVGL